MAFLLNLAEDIRSKLFCEYLTIADIVILDTALTNHFLRDTYLSIVNKRKLAFQLSEKQIQLGIGILCLRWLFCRGMHVSTLSLGHDITDLHVELFPIKFQAISTWVISNPIAKHRLSRECVVQIAKKCSKSIKNLYIQSQLSAEAALAIIENSPLLRSFEMETDTFIPSDSFLNQMAESCPQLNHLKIVNADQLTNSSLQMIAKYCINLKSISLSGDYCDITDDGMLQLACSCQELESLSLSIENRSPRSNSNAIAHISDAALSTLACKCRNLSELRLGCYSHVSDAGFIAVAESCLKLIKLSIHNKLGEATRISDATIITFAECCKSLQEVSLSNFPNLTDVALIQLAENCKHLTRLELMSAPQITDKSIVEFANNCKKLVAIDFRDISIANTGLIKIVENCPELTSISLWRCSKISDASMHFIASCCRNLSALIMHSNPGVYSDVYLLAIAQNNPRLKSGSIHISDCGSLLCEKAGALKSDVKLKLKAIFNARSAI